MPDVILDGTGSGYPVKVTNTNALLVTGSVNSVVNVGSVIVHSENVPYDSNEQLVFLAGSPSSSVNAFINGVVKTLTIKCDEDTYVRLGSGTVSVNNFLVYAGEAISSNFLAGSVSTLAKDSLGSVWVWGGR